jgi:hypothetical protein
LAFHNAVARLANVSADCSDTFALGERLRNAAVESTSHEEALHPATATRVLMSTSRLRE